MPASIHLQGLQVLILPERYGSCPVDRQARSKPRLLKGSKWWSCTSQTPSKPQSQSPSLCALQWKPYRHVNGSTGTQPWFRLRCRGERSCDSADTKPSIPEIGARSPRAEEKTESIVIDARLLNIEDTASKEAWL